MRGEGGREGKGNHLHSKDFCSLAFSLLSKILSGRLIQRRLGNSERIKSSFPNTDTVYNMVVKIQDLGLAASLYTSSCRRSDFQRLYAI